MADYIPRPDKDFGPWLDNFTTKVTAMATKYSFNAANILQMTNDNTMWTFIVKNIDAADNFAKQFTSFKNTLRNGAIGTVVVPFPIAPSFTPIPTSVANGIEKRTRAVVKLIKANPNYTEADGKLMGIIGEDPVTTSLVTEVMKPVLTLVTAGGKVIVKWKKGKADSINIYVDRGDGDLIYFANDATPDFVDNTPFPAEAGTWRYNAIYVIGDQEVGQFSDPVSVLVKKYM